MSQERQLLIELLALKELKEEYMRLKQRRSVWLKKDKELMAKVAQMKKEHDERYPVVWDKVKALLRPVDKSETTQYSDEWLKQRGQKARETLSQIPAELTAQVAEQYAAGKFPENISLGFIGVAEEVQKQEYTLVGMVIKRINTVTRKAITTPELWETYKALPARTKLFALTSDCPVVEPAINPEDYPDIVKRVYEIIWAEVTDINNNLIADLGFDSLDKSELVMELEDQFELDRIPDQEADKFTTVLDIIQYVVKKTAEKNKTTV